jgi:hypothetical protein
MGPYTKGALSPAASNLLTSLTEVGGSTLGFACEVETLERAFHSLIELGDQQMADLYCIQEWM